MHWLRPLLFLWILSFAPSLLQGAAAQVYFSPQDKISERLIELIEKEKKQILIAVYCFTHRGIADALIQAKRRGVVVDVIVDPFTLKSRMACAKLKQASVGISVWDAGLMVPATNGKEARKRARRPLMHDKFCVFGDNLVWTGSFNFTYDATDFHRENVVVIEDREVAGRYVQQFYDIKRQAGRSYEEYLACHPRRKKNVLDALNRR